MNPKKPCSIAYDGVIYEVKKVMKVMNPNVSSNQMALVVRDPNKTANEIMLVNEYEFIEAAERPIDREYFELKGPIVVMSAEDWVHSFRKEKKE